MKSTNQSSIKIPKVDICNNSVPRICILKQIHAKLLLEHGEWRISLNKCLMCNKKEKLLMAVDALNLKTNKKIKKTTIGAFVKGTCLECKSSTYVSSKQSICRSCIQLKSVKTKKEQWKLSQSTLTGEQGIEITPILDSTIEVQTVMKESDKLVSLNFSKYSLDDLYVKLSKTALDEMRAIEDQILFILKTHEKSLVYRDQL